MFNTVPFIMFAETAHQLTKIIWEDLKFEEREQFFYILLFDFCYKKSKCVCVLFVSFLFPIFITELHKSKYVGNSFGINVTNTKQCQSACISTKRGVALPTKLHSTVCRHAVVYTRPTLPSCKKLNIFKLCYHFVR